MAINQEMRYYINILNEAKVDKSEARNILTKLSPAYAKVKGDDKLEEVRINKATVKSIGIAMAFVAVAVGGVNVSMVGPLQTVDAMELSQTIEQDLRASYNTMPDGYDDWQINVEPAAKTTIASDDQDNNSDSTQPHDLESKVAQRMAQRIAEMEAQGVTVEHNYNERHDQVPDTYTADYGPWEGREGYANVPDNPSIVNLFVMEEEFAHALGSDEELYGKDPIHMMWEEFRAKHYAQLKVEEVFELDAAAHTQNKMTRQNYVDFARQMSQYTRQSYSDELVANIRNHANAVAEEQYASGTISISNSNDYFADFYAR